MPGGGHGSGEVSLSLSVLISCLCFVAMFWGAEALYTDFELHGVPVPLTPVLLKREVYMMTTHSLWA